MGDSLYSENSMIQTHLQNSRIKKEKKVGALIALSGEEKRKGDDNVDARNRKMYEEMVGLGIITIQALEHKLNVKVAAV